MGDVVGYGPHPNECLDLLRSYDHICLPGNHDWGALGQADPRTFNAEARFALEWTAERLTADNRAYLEALPELCRMPDAPFHRSSTPARATPSGNTCWSRRRPRSASPSSTRRYCLVGHTHVPAVFRQSPEDGPVKLVLPEDGESVRLANARLIMNPGSVGQPRDHDPRAPTPSSTPTRDTLEFWPRRVPHRRDAGGDAAAELPPPPDRPARLRVLARRRTVRPQRRESRLDLAFTSSAGGAILAGGGALDRADAPRAVHSTATTGQPSVVLEARRTSTRPACACRRSRTCGGAGRPRRQAGRRGR